MAASETEIVNSSENCTQNKVSEDDKKDLLKDLADDYASYLDVDIKKEKTQLDESIEEMLTRLDEFCGLVDLIRSDTSLCINETIPQIQAKSLQLEAIFKKIDKLEEFVGMVKTNLAVVEEEVNKAEDEMGSFSSIKKMFSSIQLPFMRKNPAQPRRPEVKPRFEAPSIFCADDYFGAQPVKKRSKSQTDRQRAWSVENKSRSKSESGGVEGAVGGVSEGGGADSGIEVAAEATTGDS